MPAPHQRGPTFHECGPGQPDPASGDGLALTGFAGAVIVAVAMWGGLIWLLVEACR